MGELDKEFMDNLEEARKLIPKIECRMDALSDVPEDLDNPTDQEEVDGVIKFGTELARLTGALNKLAIKMCVGKEVQAAFDAEEEEEEEETESLDEKYSEFGHKRSDF